MCRLRLRTPGVDADTGPEDVTIESTDTTIRPDQDQDVEATRQVLARDMKRVVAACLNLCPKPAAIVLYGGYGRGEGSWYQDDPGLWHPYNDYDVLIVAEDHPPRSRVVEAEKALAAEVGIRWIDLSVRTPDELRAAAASILNYDIKYASRVLYGDSTTLDLIPLIDASRLSWVEAKVLYNTRLYTFLGCFDEAGPGSPLRGEGSRFFRNQMAKAVLSVVDVLLLAGGLYDASYRERIRRVLELHPDRADLQSLCPWALSEKLRPRAPEMSGAEALELYHAVRDLFLAEMYPALSIHFGRTIDGPEDLVFATRWLPINLLKRIYWMIKFRSMQVERKHAVFFAQAFLLSAYRREGIHEPHLETALSLLRKLDPTISSGADWNRARIEAARLRMET